MTRRPRARISKAGRHSKQFKVDLVGCQGFSMLDFCFPTLEQAVEEARAYLGEDCEMDLRLTLTELMS